MLLWLLNNNICCHAAHITDGKQFRSVLHMSRLCHWFLHIYYCVVYGNSSINVQLVRLTYFSCDFNHTWHIVILFLQLFNIILNNMPGEWLRRYIVGVICFWLWNMNLALSLSICVYVRSSECTMKICIRQVYFFLLVLCNETGIILHQVTESVWI